MIGQILVKGRIFASFAPNTAIRRISVNSYKSSERLVASTILNYYSSQSSKNRSLERLIRAFRCLPGVGPKTAQRMVYYLLQHQRQRGLELANCLHEAMSRIENCQRCNNFSEELICDICKDTARDNTQLCIIESPSDLIAIENSQTYRGKYFVLMGKISPLDGIGPEEIGLAALPELITRHEMTEVILALSPTVEGQATAYFIQELLKPMQIKITQLAYGIPSGGELEYLDGKTISFALRNRLIL